MQSPIQRQMCTPHLQSEVQPPSFAWLEWALRCIAILFISIAANKCIPQPIPHLQTTYTQVWPAHLYIFSKLFRCPGHVAYSSIYRAGTHTHTHGKSHTYLCDFWFCSLKGAAGGVPLLQVLVLWSNLPCACHAVRRSIMWATLKWL